MKKVTGILIVLFMQSTLFLYSQESSSNGKEIFDRGIVQHTFVPRGQWLTGLNFSYYVTDSDNFKLLMLDKLRGEGYTLKVSPYLGYTLKDNLAVGLRFMYKRTYVNIEEATIKLSDDVNFDIDNAYMLQHTYYGTAFVRNYISIGESMRFGLYNEVQLTLGGGQGKTTNGSGDTFTGTYQNTFEFELGMSPGVVAFINNLIAVDVSVGLMGFNVTSIKQTTDQVYEGSFKSASANFKINIFSINLGISLYIPTLNPF